MHDLRPQAIVSPGPALRDFCHIFRGALGDDPPVHVSALLRKTPADNIPNVCQPRPPLLRRAGHHHRKRPSMNFADAAQTEDTILPESVERIAEGLSFSLFRRVGGVEDQGHLRLQETDRHALAAVPLEKLVGEAGPDDPVDPTPSGSPEAAPTSLDGR